MAPVRGERKIEWRINSPGNREVVHGTVIGTAQLARSFRTQTCQTKTLFSETNDRSDLQTENGQNEQDRTDRFGE